VAAAHANLALRVRQPASVRVVREYAEERVRERLEVLRLEYVLVVVDATLASRK
jgi:hypothetical protein